MLTFGSFFQGKEDKLEELLDTEHGLLAKLEARYVITRNHRRDIEVTFATVCYLLSRTL